MFFLFLFLISSIPFCIGIAILRLFKSNNLSKVIFLFPFNEFLLATKCYLFVCTTIF